MCCSLPSVMGSIVISVSLLGIISNTKVFCIFCNFIPDIYKKHILLTIIIDLSQHKKWSGHLRTIFVGEKDWGGKFI